MTKPDVFVFDDLNPEDNAMLQALYSRSPDSVVNHREKVAKTGSGKFMDQFYVGYGHASIGDCGTTTIYIEQVSMLAAKAIQDNPLYSGQEASTRYLDFAKQACYDPYHHPAAKAVLDGWMALYQDVLAKLIDEEKRRNPFDGAQHKSEKVWENACKARAFDMARGLLPLGATTLLSWTTNLRQARDKLRALKVHPAGEIAELAQTIYATLLEKYPNSFKADDMAFDTERHAARDAYTAECALADNYLAADRVMAAEGWGDHEVALLKQGEVLVDRTLLDRDSLNRLAAIELQGRTAWTPLPRRLERYGSYTLSFLLDFGSYRDIQRHRNGVCQIPLVDGRFGFMPWYIQQYKDYLGQDFAAVEARIDALLADIAKLADAGLVLDPVKTQYLFPMGLAALCQLTYSVPQMVYVAELRSQATVHPTLRPIAQKMGDILLSDFPHMSLFIDRSADGWSEKRGTQTISQKSAA